MVGTFARDGKDSGKWMIRFDPSNRLQLQGAIYDKLYAPGGIKSLSERQRQGQEFIIKIHEVLAMNQKVSVFIPIWASSYMTDQILFSVL